MPKLPFLIAVLPAAAPALAYEQPAYEVLWSGGDYEVRDYAPYLVAESTVPGGFDESGGDAFRRLAGYNFGDNRRPDADAPDGGESLKMNMTVPVTRHRGGEDGDTTVYRFVMERSYELDTLPVPNDEGVTLRQVPGGPVSVLRYRGRITASRFEKHAKRLQ